MQSAVDDGDANGDHELGALLDFRGQLMGRGRGKRRDSGFDRYKLY